MSGVHELHTDVLYAAQRELLPRLVAALADTGYYLAGGTALALQLGHRTSVDFDWFIETLGEPETLFTRLRKYQIDFTVRSIDIETVYVNMQGVQVSFIGYAYPLLQPVLVWSEISLRMASLDDIACMKLSAIASRGARKDFLDLHFLITHFRSLSDYLRLYRQKYQQRDLGHVLRSLVYFADAEREPEIPLHPPVVWETLTTDFQRWVVQLDNLS